MWTLSFAIGYKVMFLNISYKGIKIVHTSCEVFDLAVEILSVYIYVH
jgi:hypothetical protein